jgi:hypothetical protein
MTRSGGSIYRVPYDSQLFVTGAAAMPVAAAAAAAAAGEGTPASRVAALLGSALLQSSVSQVSAFISSFAGRPDLNTPLHEPALNNGTRSVEGLPGSCCVGLMSLLMAALRTSSAGSSASTQLDWHHKQHTD